MIEILAIGSIAIIGLVILNIFLLRELQRLTAFIMAQKNSTAFEQSLWKPWETKNNGESITQEEQDKQDYMKLMGGMECDDTDIKRFGEEHGVIS